MIELDRIYNEDCKKTLENLMNDNIGVDCILTSPPYNMSKKVNTQRSLEIRQNMYDIYMDSLSNSEYYEWIVSLFCNFDKILKKDGVVLWNISYSTDTYNLGDSILELPWLCIANIIQNSPFIVADKIIWKKLSALPNNTSSNKLTRICEDVFVFCRKSEIMTFFCNKGISSVGSNGQKYYKNTFNFIQAPNNDGSNPYNKATFSSSFCKQLMGLYCPKGGIVYDPFMGTGTTAIACIDTDRHYIGSELSENQVKYANERIEKLLKDRESIFDL